MYIHAGIFLQSFEVFTLEMFGSLLAEILFGQNKHNPLSRVGSCELNQLYMQQGYLYVKPASGMAQI
jgi:hypothetical protein